jgi:hypothetical protein
VSMALYRLYTMVLPPPQTTVKINAHK